MKCKNRKKCGFYLAFGYCIRVIGEDCADLKEKNMTIDEVIDGLKRVFGNYELDLPCTDSLNILSNTVMLLKELKELRKTTNEHIEKSYDRGKEIGYNKAIDDFKAECHKQISKNHEKYGFNQRDLVNLDLAEIDMIAEQLKGERANG